MADQRVVLVHHAEAVGPEVDTRRPLSARGRAGAAALARLAAERGITPRAVWHSGKLRARETAGEFLDACNPLAMFTAMRGLQPTDPVETALDAVRRTSDDLVIVGHLPHLPRLLRRLVGEDEDQGPTSLPLHGMVVLVSNDNGLTWRETWRATEPDVW